MKRNFFLMTMVMLAVAYCSHAQTIQLANVSQDVFCSTGKDTMRFSVNYSSIPANSNVVFYQSTNPSFNPYNGEGDSIGFINVGANTSGGGQITTPCQEILGIFIDACDQGGVLREVDNEYMVITSGSAGFNVSNLKIQLPNATINSGSCPFLTPSAATMTQLRNGTCNTTTLLAAGQGDFIPANSIVIIFTGRGALYNYNFSSYCSSGQPIYILQNSCSPGTANFVNNKPNTCPSFRTTKITVGSCVDALTYNPCTLPVYDNSNPNANDGNYVIHLPNTDTSSIANGGIKNNAADKCNGIRFDSISGLTIIKFPIPNDGGNNTATNFCNTGYHYIKAIVNPNGIKPVSNTIQFKLVCLDVDATVAKTTICSGQNTNVQLASTDPNAIFSWVANAGASISGASNGSGSLINQTLTNNGTIKDSVTYTGVVTDAGCSASQKIKIYVNPSAGAISLGNDTSVCTPISVPLSTGNPTTVWSRDGVQIATAAAITATQAGTYVATITSDCGNVSATKVITQLSVPAPFNLGKDTAVCLPISLQLSTGNVNTVWTKDGTSLTTGAAITATAIGTYKATIANTCGSVSDEIIISQTTTGTPFSLGNDTTYCGNFSRTLSTGNATTQWTRNGVALPAGASITVTTPGTYKATIVNNCGTVSDEIILSQSAGLSFTFGSSSTSVCKGQSITLDAGAGFSSYAWNTGESSSSIIVTTPGKYWVTVTKNGCSGSDTINVNEINPPVPFSLGRDSAFCGNFSWTLSAGNTQAVWTRNGVQVATGATFTVTQAGTYKATITNSCATVSDEVIVTVTIGTPVNLGRDTTLCSGNAIQLDATLPGSNTYQWNTGEKTAVKTVSQQGKYWVDVFNGACSVSDTINISVVSAPVAFTLGSDTSYCGPFTRVISTGVSSTVWSTGISAAQITITSPGTYIATVSNTCGTERDEIKIDQFPLPNVSIGRDTTFCDSITLTVGNSNFAFIQWSTGASAKSITVDASGKYSVIVSNANCSNGDTIQLIEDCAYEVYMPTAFSPNNDGINDVLVPLSNESRIVILDYSVFNRWGEKVFEASNFQPNNQRAGWDGTFKGDKCEVDQYVFVLTAKMPDNTVKTYKGSVTLVK